MRRGNTALITTLPVLDCLNSVQHVQPRCLEESFLPLQPRKKQEPLKHKSFQLKVSHLWEPKMRPDDLYSQRRTTKNTTHSSTFKKSRHFTPRWLLITGPAHIFALYVSVRLPEPLGSSSVLPRDPRLDLGSCVDLLHAQIVRMYSFVLCLGHLVFS